MVLGVYCFGSSCLGAVRSKPIPIQGKDPKVKEQKLEMCIDCETQIGEHADYFMYDRDYLICMYCYYLNRQNDPELVYVRRYHDE